MLEHRNGSTMPATDTEVSRSSVKVYREGPAWDALGGRPWFMMPVAELAALFVAEYKVLDDRFGEGLAEIEALHPGSVLVYVHPN